MSQRSAGATREAVASLRHALALAAIVSGLVMMVAAAGIARSPATAPNVGTQQAQRLAESSADSSPPGPSTVTAPTPLGHEDPRPPATLVAPVSLRINAIGVDAAVAPTGVDTQTGLIAVPSDVDTLGWYRFSQGLDTTSGSIVIVGHLDSADQGPGALFNLSRVSVGDEVIATGTDGHERHFRIIAREQYRKTSVPLDRIFARGGSPRLTLATCGGRFDEHDRSYLDNLVVTAVPTSLGG
jgi:Sortase domain